MIDFYEQLGEQLKSAERALALTASRPTRRRRRSVRAVTIALAGLALAVPAFAATEPWQLVFGRPAMHDTPAGLSRTQVPSDQLAVLAVLRRPQTPQDRGARAQTLVQSFGVEFRGLRPDSLRVVNTPSGHAVALVSAQAIGNPNVTLAEGTDVLCLTAGKGGACGDSRALGSGTLIAFHGDHVFGIVPDRVAQVILRYPNGSGLSARVTQNIFWIDGTPTVSRDVPGAPPVRRSERPSSVVWLDASGRVVAPSAALASADR
jgi:hypothetical protein